MEMEHESEEEQEVMVEKLKVLGRGGFATVYLATPCRPDTPLPPLLAVKSLDFPASHDLPSSAQSLIFEWGVLNVLLDPSPFIIRSYGRQLLFHHDTQHFTLDLFLECASCSLDKRIPPHGLPESKVRPITCSILSGLNHIHHHGIVHCDLKPENVLLVPASSSHDSPTHGFLPKIADFGLAKIAGQKLHELRGTYSYMAPESVSDSEYEPPSDIWAFGCLVLELFTGRPAWDDYPAAAHSNTLLHLIAHTTELPTLPTTLSDQATDFLRKCLVRDPKLRWTSEMLLTHPFLSMVQPRGTKRQRACSVEEDYTLLQGGKRRITTRQEEVDKVVHQLPQSIHTASAVGLGSADYIPL